jgi:DNA polymerase-3 subunit alpha
LLTSIRVITTKKGDRMAFLKLEDLQGEIEAVVFPRTYEQVQPLLVEDNILLVRGKVEARNDRMSVLADVIQLYEATLPMAEEQTVAAPPAPPLPEEASLLDGMAHHVTITLRRSADSAQDVARLHEALRALKQFPGADRVSLRCVHDDGKVVLLDFPVLATKWNARLRDTLGGVGLEYDVRDLTPARPNGYRQSA